MSKFKVGDKVRIIDNKQTHNAWKTAFKDNSISGYKVLFCHNNNEVVEVIKDFNQTLLFVRNENGTSLINIKGVEKVENFTRDDLKQGMVMINRNGNIRTMVSDDKYYLQNNTYSISDYFNYDLTSQNVKTEDIIKVTFGNEIVYERLESKTTWFEPKENEKYYYFDIAGNIYINNTNSYDELILKNNQVFETEEQAEKHLIWQQAHVRILKEIARLNEGWTPNWEDYNERKFFLEYLYEEGEESLVIDCYSSYQLLPNNMYLKSQELAEQLIETHKDDLLIYFEVEK